MAAVATGAAAPRRDVRMRLMAGRERYAVVSCHVERPLENHIWARFAELQERRHGGFPVAALIRSPDPAHDEDETVWLQRAKEAAARGPFGQHTHWTAPDHARPTGGDPGGRVLEEGRRLRELGLTPTLFCGGGWYADLGVAEACAELAYVDCTATAYRPPYLTAGAPRFALAVPARVVLPSGRRLLAVPSTHSLGMLARQALTLAGPRAGVVHVHFHDTDLVDPRRRAALIWALRVLGRRRAVTDLDALATLLGEAAPEVTFEQVAAG
jgi:hypothetical protein